ncbi:unnamed protein product [Ilex paraguariensis]|uniref:Uncharacterized protein n=1 Tax=Ilex paraguariensis TaxID=185542 RepID=A0ABC8RXV3_9AQUA
MYLLGVFFLYTAFILHLLIFDLSNFRILLFFLFGFQNFQCISTYPFLGWDWGGKIGQVDIWEERKVFGSRGQNLKDEMLGKNPPPLLVSNGKNSNPIKIVKRDAHSLRIKLAVGAIPERIVTAFHLVHDANVNEEAALDKCKDAVRRAGEMDKDVDNMSAQGMCCTCIL